jgi:O-Antigen ligase
VLFTLILLLATMIATAVVASALIPTRVALWVGSAVNVVQLHSISILGIYPSIALLSWLSLWRAPFGSALWRWPWMQALLVLVAVQAASLVWSPSPMLGVRYLLYLLPLPFVAHAMYQLTQERPHLAERCLNILLLGSALEAALVMVFRVLPSVEMAFLNHPIGQLFVSPNTLQVLFDSHNNNVPDPAKAGGVFVNANVAATYLGVFAVAAWYVSRISGSAILRAVAIFDWLAVFFTGSKAGLLCALAIPACLAVGGMIRTKRVSPALLAGATIGGVLAATAFVLPLGNLLVEDYQRDTLATLGGREEMWRMGLNLLLQRPFTGLGFGGWEQRFQVYGFASGVAVTAPPHNSRINLWLQSGVFGVLAGLALVIAVYAATARALRVTQPGLHHLAFATAGAFSWCLLQGMGENFGLIGEIHMMPLLGALLGHLCSRCDGALECHDNRIATLRGAPASPAVQVV